MTGKVELPIKSRRGIIGRYRRAGEVMSVTFKVVTTGKVVTRNFDSYYLCRKFIQKARYSRKITLISYPNLNK